MSVGSLIQAAILDGLLEYATKNLRIEKLLIQAGLDPNNVTYDAIFDRVLELVLVNITISNMLALVGSIFLIMTFVVRTIVPLRVLSIVSCFFQLGAAALSGSVPHFFLYLLALPINFIRLFQIRNLVKKARNSAKGDLSLDWLKPYMAPRKHQKGDVLFLKGDPATEMFLTVAGKFLVTEIGIEIPPGRILGELGFVSPQNNRTQSVECIEDGEILTISYEKLRGLYLSSPEFGYFFLRLTSDRLLQNHARLEGLVEEAKAALDELNAIKNANDPANAGNEKKPLAAALLRAAGVRRQNASGAARWAADDGAPDWATMVTAAAEAEAARRRVQALAIVERHANFSAIGGFIPLPIVNTAAIAAVQVRMVRELYGLYSVPFEFDLAYGAAIGLLGGVMPSRLAAVATTTAMHFLPGANLFGLAVSSVAASAYARRVGMMLVDHFERAAALERERMALQRARSWQNILRSGFPRSVRARSRSSSEPGARRNWLRR